VTEHKLPTGGQPSEKYANPVLRNIYARRSVRNYKPDPVPDEVLLELIKAGIYAPTARNQQAWRFAVVTNKEDIDRYSDRAKELWRKNLALKAAGILGIGGVSRYVKMMSSPALHLFHHAPALVFIFAPKGRFVAEDCACAAENMMLAASSLELGSCWIGFAMPLGSDKKTLEELQVPKGYKMMAALVFGYPTNEVRKAPARNEDILISWVE
jgi:nitroreductase